jgi:membrane-bound metal-dependent hydrolase YbcI (DUF457 family)
MASPVGHVIVGVGVAGAMAGALGADNTPALWMGAAIAACAPDLDVLPSLWGVPYQRVHRQASHSILILAPLAVVSWVGFLALDPPVDWRFMVAWTAALMSHLVLDVLCTGPLLGRQGLGIPLLWPLTPRRWCVTQPMFPEVNLLEGCSPGAYGRVCLQELILLSPAAGAGILLAHLL